MPTNVLPRYQCHKSVSAAKIAAVTIRTDAAGTTIELQLEGGSRLVSPEYMTKHRPTPGGWYVCYDDGYESFSPDQAFVAGYTRIDGGLGGPTPPPPSTD